MPGRVEMDMAEAGFGQRHFEFILQGVEGLAGMGRGAVVEAGGIREALGDRHVAEDPRRVQLHKADFIIRKRAVKGGGVFYLNQNGLSFVC